MKKIRSFKMYVLITLLVALLVIQPTTIVYYAKGADRQLWELVTPSTSQEGEFTEEPQEIVFVYRRKKSSIPSQLITIPPTIATIPPGREQSSRYGELLRGFSGIFLFGSMRS
ncbi:MucBP domain-containing protein [Enterococcus wangshanyuanii]|uniref:Uncharacterized protein n=1 Tax=Enterococcus wangshanyuanii TaxID=2005703 RepID=A0ABQ1PGZ2_9ENTE|nr:MucBP domain-containing protein [Enterococcus wangshanyuanii]GGC97183.1 hypothetical protein GCM10011573_28420 [Enterococcus wangshanyuanii]